MLTITQAQIDIWFAMFWWPYLRIFGLMISDPFFSGRAIPVRVRIGLSILLALLVGSGLQDLPTVSVVSPEGMLIAIKEILIGAAIGFVVRILFSCLEMAGHLAGLQMGLGFATFYDPQHSTNVPIVAQLLSMMMLLVFLAFNGHLIVLRALFESYAQLPISATPLGATGFRLLVDFGEIIFRAGLMLSLPVLAALLVTNLAIGVMTRAAPQLNVFAIGFPITLAIGTVALYLLLPFLLPHIDAMLGEMTRFYLKLLRAFAV